MSIVLNAATMFCTKKCRPGTLAKHPEHGVVRVVRAEGMARTIEVERRVLDEPEGTAENVSDEVAMDRLLRSERLLVSEVDVPLRDLIELDPFRDLEPPAQVIVFPATFASAVSY